MKRKNEFVRGIQFDSLTLRQVDDLARRWGMSRSQVVKTLVRKAAAKDSQQALPGFGQGVQ